jgi:ribosomal protein S14
MSFKLYSQGGDVPRAEDATRRQRESRLSTPMHLTCRMCGDSSTHSFASVSGLCRHCVAAHAHVYRSDGRYVPIPEEQLLDYKSRVAK